MSLIYNMLQTFMDLNKYTLDTQLQMLATLYANKDRPSVKEIVDQLHSYKCWQPYMQTRTDLLLKKL